MRKTIPHHKMKTNRVMNCVHCDPVSARVARPARTD